MRWPALAGLPAQQAQAGHTQGFAPPLNRAIGNQLPGNTGVWDPTPSPRGPGPYHGTDGNLGGNDGTWGTDPRAAKIVSPVFLPVRRYPAGEPGGMDASTRGTPTWWRNGIIGFNDQLRVVDRHAYWDTGTQLTGTTFHAASAHPNSYNNPRQEKPYPNLRTVNRSVTHQIGSDNSANQDDLARPYSRNPQGMYIGEQGSGWSPVYGGTPDLYQPYGSRGGVPYPIVSPVAYGAAGDGPQKVWAGPPHGLHSLTYPNNADTLARYTATPQMRPVRIDRPSNSPQAGQSYSQTVRMQGQQGAGSHAGKSADIAAYRGRGWRGTGG